MRLIPAFGNITDETTADALGYKNKDIDIYTNSWSPTNGLNLAGGLPLTLMSLEQGITEGRGGLGNIYVFSAGNNREFVPGWYSGDDNVNYNGNANSRYTIAVGAIDHNGVHSSYSEPGAPLLISAYSSGNRGPRTTTTDLLGDDGGASGDYRNNFGGTSSAAPLVSGVVALMLDANPNLTWRDVQHILVDTASQNDQPDTDWVTNGAGHDINHKYGFGAVDANAAVSTALSWTNVDAEETTSGEKTVEQTIPNYFRTSSTISITDNLNVEWVEVVFDADHSYRGDLEITLTSPDGTESILAERRNDSGDDYQNWVFTSARHWDESSLGDWTLTVADTAGGDVGTWNSWELNVYGTTRRPVNDNLAESTPISPLSTTLTGSNINATKEEPEEPFHDGKLGGSSVWWSWTAPTDGDVTINTFGSDFDTILAAYTGSSLSGLSLVESNNDANEEEELLQSEITFSAVANTTYQIAVDGKNGAQGNITLDLSFPINDDFDNPIIIDKDSLSASVTGHNIGATREPGERYHAGNYGGSSVWWEWEAPSSGSVNIVTYGSDFDTTLGVYTGSSVNNLTEVASHDSSSYSLQSEVNFIAEEGENYKIAVDGKNGAEGNIVLSLFLDTNDDLADSKTISGSSASVTGSNVYATKENGEDDHAGNAANSSVWWDWTAPSNGSFTISTNGSNFDTILGVYTGSSVDNLTAVASDDNSGYGLQSKVTFDALAGENYKIAVDGKNGAQGNINLDLTLQEDDNYESNNTPETAYDITGNKRTWLEGIANDDDWYELEKTSYFGNLRINLDFTHAQGNLDLILLDSSMQYIDGSYSLDNDESITVAAPAGTYYLGVLVSDSMSGNTYDLWWDA